MFSLGILTTDNCFPSVRKFAYLIAELLICVLRLFECIGRKISHFPGLHFVKQLIMH